MIVEQMKDFPITVGEQAVFTPYEGKVMLDGKVLQRDLAERSGGQFGFHGRLVQKGHAVPGGGQGR